MNYSDNPAMVRVDFFKPSGKWYCTEAVKWTGAYYGSNIDGQTFSSECQPIYDAFAQSLRDHLEKRLSDMTAICLEPYHQFTHPLMIKDGGWWK